MVCLQNLPMNAYKYKIKIYKTLNYQKLTSMCTQYINVHPKNSKLDKQIHKFLNQIGLERVDQKIGLKYQGYLVSTMIDKQFFLLRLNLFILKYSFIRDKIVLQILGIKHSAIFQNSTLVTIYKQTLQASIVINRSTSSSNKKVPTILKTYQLFQIYFLIIFTIIEKRKHAIQNKNRELINAQIQI
eukprot:TRINITY_DN3242_c0_g1_i5.p2 TRINITY_DN3242_c0_g1~~TRINITY_DN3242_c0_g1_i5.p2  ORF type:complete len:186 (+),score=-20.12 TRINITY_DN3242_c0_g1_i5:601-1158(+)